MSNEHGSSERHEITLASSDPSQLGALREWFHGLSEVEVRIAAGSPGPGEQGAADVLAVLAGSSGALAAIKMLPEFIRSRRSGFRIETTLRGEKFVLEATNVQDVLPLIERLLDD